MRRVLGFVEGLIVAVVVLIAVVVALRSLSSHLDLDYERLREGLAPWVFPFLLLGGAAGAWKAPLPAAAWSTALGVLVGMFTFLLVGETLSNLHPPRWLAVPFVFGWIPIWTAIGFLVGRGHDRRRRPPPSDRSTGIP